MERSHPVQSAKHTGSSPGLIVGAIGVVFGDIGTSPIYTLRECLKAAGGVNQANVFGIVSLIFWAIIIVVTLKYVTFVMRADNDGEGGIVALTALASDSAPERMRSVLLTLGVFGAAMFYGDSMVTPAISVLSAVEGVSLINAHLKSWVVPIALVILVCLFGIQKRGTGVVGKVFGPVMLLWFLALTCLGLFHIVGHPGILEAAAPGFAASFVVGHPGLAFIVLGAVILALTGAEALYADMGHFGKKPIRLAWLFLVLPSILLNYFGQAAMVLAKPNLADQPFFSSAPAWALIPVVALATAATIIASQAVISGAFSMTKQAIQIGLLPHLSFVHTSGKEIGQIFVPFVNLFLFIAVIFLVVVFQSSDRLAAAYGMAVASTMLLTTLLMAFITHYRWRWRPLWTVTVVSPLLAIDTAFVSSNSRKLLDGGWFPIFAGILLFIVMLTWHRGRGMLIARIKLGSQPLAEMIRALCDDNRVARVDGTAVYPGNVADLAPTAFTHNLKHNRVLHRTNIFVNAVVENVPFVSDAKKICTVDLGGGCYAVTLRHGFMEMSNIPELLHRVEDEIPGWRYQPQETSFFLARDTVEANGEDRSMARWRESLFVFLGRNSATPAKYYGLPPERVVEVGGLTIL
jgi:KUP system potassium uptake protein